MVVAEEARQPNMKMPEVTRSESMGPRSVTWLRLLSRFLSAERIL
jgi:hypothetical protein